MQAHRGRGSVDFIWHLIGRLTPRRVTAGQRGIETGRVSEGRKISCFHSQISLAAIVYPPVTARLGTNRLTPCAQRKENRCPPPVLLSS